MIINNLKIIVKKDDYAYFKREITVKKERDKRSERENLTSICRRCSQS